VKRLIAILVGAGFICALGCGASPEPAIAENVVDIPKEEGLVPALLDPPFTAEQIRDEWVEGFQLQIRRWTADEEIVERWTVVRTDADGVDIESVVLEESGSVAAEAHVQTSSWVQLRDHASFPADRATREAVSRETPLGELQGWLYSVTDGKSGTVTEFFFAEALPGAPVFVHVLREGEIVEIFEQVKRHRPADGE